MACLVRDACTFRTDAQQGLENNAPAGPTPRASPRSDHGQMGMPMRDLHLAVREHVRQELYSELEPVRVQLAMQQRQVQQLNVNFENFNERAHQLQALALREPTEKKMDTVPGLEAWKRHQDNRLSDAESILSEVTEQQHKFSQRQDWIIQCIADLDERCKRFNKMALDMSAHTPPTRGRQQHSPGWSPTRYDVDLDEHTEDVLPLSNTAEVSARSSSSRQAIPTLIPIEESFDREFPPDEFQFEVTMSPGSSLGLLLRNDGEVLVIDKINEGCPLPVEVGDHILAVNGVCSDSGAVLRQLQQKGRMVFKCARRFTTTL